MQNLAPIRPLCCYLSSWRHLQISPIITSYQVFLFLSWSPTLNKVAWVNFAKLSQIICLLKTQHSSTGNKRPSLCTGPWALHNRSSLLHLSSPPPFWGVLLAVLLAGLQAVCRNGRACSCLGVFALGLSTPWKPPPSRSIESRSIDSFKSLFKSPVFPEAYLGHPN